LAVILNKYCGTASFSGIKIDHGEIEDFSSGKMPFYIGGPMHEETSYVFFRDVEKPFHDRGLCMGLSARPIDQNAFYEITERKIVPENVLVTLGLTVWSLGQLATEIENNIWIVRPYDCGIVFPKNRKTLWEDCQRKKTLRKKNRTLPCSFCNRKAQLG
jgi:putative AlgH/UPF0301 family transcriptional regulator